MRRPIVISEATPAIVLGTTYKQVKGQHGSDADPCFHCPLLSLTAADSLFLQELGARGSLDQIGAKVARASLARKGSRLTQ